MTGTRRDTFGRDVAGEMLPCPSTLDPFSANTALMMLRRTEGARRSSPPQPLQTGLLTQKPRMLVAANMSAFGVEAPLGCKLERAVLSRLELPGELAAQAVEATPRESREEAPRLSRAPNFLSVKPWCEDNHNAPVGGGDLGVVENVGELFPTEVLYAVPMLPSREQGRDDLTNSSRSSLAKSAQSSHGSGANTGKSFRRTRGNETSVGESQLNTIRKSLDMLSR